MTTVTALVVSYNTGRYLKDCLYALASDPAVTATVVVDNGNPEDMTLWLDAFAAGRDSVTLLRPGTNLGFGAAVNLAATEASSDYLLVINPDAVLRRKSVEPLLETHAGLREPAIVGGRIFDTAGVEARGGRRQMLTLSRAILSTLGLSTWSLEKTPPPEEPVRMPVISGAFFLMSKTGFEKVSGFDEHYFLHVEDVDLCRRAWRAGGELFYDPRAGVMHYESTSNVSSKTVARHKANSLSYYFMKFSHGPVERAMLRIILPVVRTAIILTAR
ncbi:MAG: glycosyltransferase family 2 protein [Henriciella sp.]|nr:glycosyltransferase family 2 protein [Henriciella sp.]